jgi:GMP synthase-like glutamine amidotransferase
MRIHYLQHIDFETPSNILKLLQQKKCSLTSTMLYENTILPEQNDFDTLIIMGGPMNIYEEKKYPFLKYEKKFIEKSIKNNKKILGICLGSQLLADVLGSKVYKNKEKEIGFFPIKLTETGINSTYFNGIQKEFMVFHWHGDTYDIPKTAKHLAYTDVCHSQAFSYNENVIGLQFHFELNEESINNLILNCKNELVDASFIQKEPEIRNHYKLIDPMYKILEKFFDNFLI